MNLKPRKDTKIITLHKQVEHILAKKGYSCLYNYSDFLYFKTKVSFAFSKADAIAELFINENPQIKSDYTNYIF